MYFIDTHIHLQDFNPDFAPQVIDNPYLKNMILISAKLDDFTKITTLTNQYPNKLIPSYGIHPWYAKTLISIDELEDKLQKNKNALIGEIGLDALKEKVTSNQHNLFKQQLDLSIRYNRPTIIHGAKAFNELKDYSNILKKIKFTYHGYTKNIELLNFINECNGYIGLGPMFLKQKNAPIFIKSMPLNKILFETDAPYQLKENSYNQTTKENLELLSKISTIPLSELEDILLENTLEFIKC